MVMVVPSALSTATSSAAPPATSTESPEAVMVVVDCADAS